MSILISGIDMPHHGMVINIYPDGRVAEHFDEFQKTIATAVPVPPHGDLIDPQWVRDKMVETLEVLRKVFPPGDQERHLISAIHMVGEMLDDAPIIIPGDKEAT